MLKVQHTGYFGWEHKRTFWGVGHSLFFHLGADAFTWWKLIHAYDLSAFCMCIIISVKSSASSFPSFPNLHPVVKPACNFF